MHFVVSWYEEQIWKIFMDTMINILFCYTTKNNDLLGDYFNPAFLSTFLSENKLIFGEDYNQLSLQ